SFLLAISSSSIARSSRGSAVIPLLRITALSRALRRAPSARASDGARLCSVPRATDSFAIQTLVSYHSPSEEWRRRHPMTGKSMRRSLPRIGLALLAVLFMLPAAAHAQAPWERAANNLALTFTGPLARSLALVAIVIGGLLFMYGEAGAKRQISGIVFGGGLALFAAQFLAWLF